MVWPYTPSTCLALAFQGPQIPKWPFLKCGSGHVHGCISVCFRFVCLEENEHLQWPEDWTVSSSLLISLSGVTIYPFLPIIWFNNVHQNFHICCCPLFYFRFVQNNFKKRYVQTHLNVFCASGIKLHLQRQVKEKTMTQ